MIRAALLLPALLLLLAGAAVAQTTPTFGETQVGTTCKNKAHSTDFDTLVQCTSTDATDGTLQKAPLFVGEVTSPPYPDTTCDAGKAGMIQYTATDGMQFCDGTAWAGFGGGGGTIGEVIAWTSSTPPAGFLECNGAAVSREIYADLFAVIGTTYGAGDGSTTFNLPDLRGEFLRGWDHGRGADPDAATRTGGDAIGSTQGNEVQSHGHAHWQAWTGSSGGVIGRTAEHTIKSNVTGGGSTSSTTATGGNETRPRNVNVMFAIRYALTSGSGGTVEGGSGSLSPQNFSITGDATAPEVSFDGTAAVTLNATVEKIQGLAVATATPSDGQALLWNTASDMWIPGDVAAAAGGAGSSMVEGWPDAIFCQSSQYSVIMYSVTSTLSSGVRKYRYPLPSGEYDVVFNSDGTYNTSVGLPSYDCVTNAWSISDLYANGRAFNFVGGGTAAASSVITGEIKIWPNATVPDGYLQCDGSAVSRTTYAALFAVLGTTYGTGDGSTTFNLPDYRGEFLRGWDDGRGADPDAATRTGGDTVGSTQADEFESHVHDGVPANSLSVDKTTGSVKEAAGSREYYTPGDTYSAGGNETRPRNVSVMYIIKY